MSYVHVILPLKLAWRPVYKAPDGISAGERVRVNFAGKERIGVVSEVGVSPDVDESRILEILRVEPGLQPFSTQEIRFWEFLAEYYMCSVGEVFKAACPEQKLRSEQTAARVADRAEQARLRTLSAAAETAGRRADRLAARLDAKRAALPDRRPGTKGRASLEADIARLEAELSVLRADLAARESALASFRASLQSAAPSTVPSPLPAVVSSPSPAVGPTPLPAAGSSPLPAGGTADAVPTSPSPAGGSTSAPQVLSGDMRAPVYASRIREVLAAGGQALVLAPEKAFCSALAAELGDIPVTVFSSDLSAPARRKISDAVRSGAPLVVLGTRSSLWLPWNGLRLVIVDEEQDTFHKQTEPAPRLHARDAAVALAGIHGASVLLGSSCPSLETRLNLLSGKYSLCADSAALSAPSRVRIIDIPGERRKNGMLGPLSRQLVRAINGCKGRVVLLRGWEKPDDLLPQLADLFPDRRIISSGPVSAGPVSSGSVSSDPVSAGSVSSDSVSAGPVPSGTTPSGASLQPSGAPSALAGASLQPSGTPSALAGASGAEQSGDIGGIAVMTLPELKREGSGGAQLLAVLQADALVSREDFRADERAIQLMAQFCAMCPSVIVQTAVPDRFAGGRRDADLLKERKAFGFPPYRRMVDIIISDRDANRLDEMSSALHRILTAPSSISSGTPGTSPSSRPLGSSVAGPSSHPLGSSVAGPSSHSLGAFGVASSLQPVRSSATDVTGPVLSSEDSVMVSRRPDGSALIRILLHRDATIARRKAAIRAAVDTFEHDRRYPGHIILDVDPQ